MKIPVVLSASLTFSAFALGAQAPGLPKLQHQLIWDDHGKESVLLDAIRRGAKIFSTGQPARTIKFPDSLRVLAWHQDRFLSLKEVGDEEVIFWVGNDGKILQEVGRLLETAQNVPFDFLAPLGKEGFFLGACQAFGFVKDGKASLVGIFRLREDGKLVLEDIPDISLKGPLFQIGKPAPGQTFVTLKPAYTALAPFLESLVQTPEAFILVSTRAGILWVLDRENGSVRRTVNLYSVEDKDLSATSDLEPAILGIQPRSDGKVVIAARDEVTFRTARKFFKYQKNEKYSAVWESEKAPDPQAPDDPESRKREAFFALRTFRDILWWELDPATGKLEQIYPEGAPTQLQTPQDLKRFHFHFEPGDKLKTSLDPVPAQVPQSIPQGVASKDGKERPAAPTSATPDRKQSVSLPVKGKAKVKDKA